MAGSFVRLTIDDRQWRAAQRRIAELIQDPFGLLSDIGEHLQLSVDERFERRVSPDGKPWEPVSPGYAARKRAGQATTRRGALNDPGQILQLTMDMRRLFRYQVNGSELFQGSDREYAATHQFGDPRRNIPAREWLGLSAEDDDAIEAIAHDHLQEAIGGKGG